MSDSPTILIDTREQTPLHFDHDFYKHGNRYPLTRTTRCRPTIESTVYPSPSQQIKRPFKPSPSKQIKRPFEFMRPL
jgi:hypothetical protein